MCWCMCSDSERLVTGSLWHGDFTPRIADTTSVLSTGTCEGVRSSPEGAYYLQSRRCCRSNHWLPGIQLCALCLLGMVVFASSVCCLAVSLHHLCMWSVHHCLWVCALLLRSFLGSALAVCPALPSQGVCILLMFFVVSMCMYDALCVISWWTCLLSDARFYRL